MRPTRLTTSWAVLVAGAVALLCLSGCDEETAAAFLASDDRDITVVLGNDDGTPTNPEIGPTDRGTPDDLPPTGTDTVAKPDAAQPEVATDVPGAVREFGGGILVGEIDASGFRQVLTTIRFTDPAPFAPPGSTVIGECAVSNQDPANPSPDAYGYDAGRVTIGGTSPGLDMSPIDQGGNGTGYDSGLSDSVETLLPPAGSPITVAALGGADVNAFQSIVQAPMPVTVSAPSMGLSSSHSTAQNLTVRWNVAAGDAYLITVNPLSSFYDPQSGNALLCGGEGDPGVFVIPKEALAMVRGGGNQNVAFGVTRVRTRRTSGPQIVPISASRSGGGLLSLTP